MLKKEAQVAFNLVVNQSNQSSDYTGSPSFCLSALAAGFRPSATKFDVSWLLMGTLTILLHTHFPRRSGNSTSHLNMDSRNARFISIFHGWEMFQPNLKNKLLQSFSIATLLLKHLLFLQPGLFFPQPRRIYYLPITTIMLFINLCATAIVGT